MHDWEAFVREHLALPQLTEQREQRIVRELADQLEDFYCDALAGGLSEAEAQAHARRQIQDWPGLASSIYRADRPHRRPRLAQWSEKAEDSALRKGRRWRVFADLLKDLTFAVRQLRKNPGFTLVALLTLALGIGASTALFSVVHGVLLRPFPYPHPGRLAVVSLSWPEGRFWLSEREVLTLREQSTLFEGFAVLDETSTTLLGGKEPQRLDVGLVSTNLFSLLGVQPALGRDFNADEELPGGPRSAIISFGFWQSRYGGEPDILGRLLELDGSDPFRVIGVMPADFRVILSVNGDFHQKVDLWHPHRVNYETVDRGRNLVVLARLKQGVEWGAAQSELDRIAKDSLTNPSNTYRAFPLHQDTVNEVRNALLLLLAATGFVLAIACANVANLLLARGSTRWHEVAVRAALGATRLRLVRQSLTESGLLALGGGAAGIALAWAGVKAFPWLLPPNFPRLDAIELNTLVLATAVALSLLAGLFFGLAPALRLARREVDTALKQASWGRQAGGLPTLFRSGLIVAEIALSLVLLLGGVLIVRSFVELQQENPGYNPSNTLTFTVSLPRSRYATGAAYSEFFRSLQERIEGLAGVDSVGGNMLLPFGRSLFMPSFTFYQPSGAAAGDRLNMPVLARPTLPGYFQALQARLSAGRFFTHQDNADAELVAIIDETLAQTVWPGENPLGKRLSRGGNAENPQYRKVVGVVENLRLTRLSGERSHQVYLPVSQFTPGSLSYLVRTHLPPLSLLQSVRSEVHALDPQLPLYDIGQLDQTLSQQRAPQRMTSMLMTLFAAIGLTLAMVGIYGVISFSVNRQTHEIGIRLALGATRRDIHRMVLGSGFRLAVLGVVLGLAASLALAQTIESLLFGVSTGDAANYLLVITILMLCVLLACYIPARRAARVDPLVALRYE